MPHAPSPRLAGMTWTQRFSSSPSRTRFGVGLVAVLVLLLSGPAIPRWLLMVTVGTALLMGLRAGIEQKRMERRFARSIWESLTRR